jgi:hypothetical protein
MRRLALATGFVLAASAFPHLAIAQTSAPPSSASASPPAPPMAPASAPAAQPAPPAPPPPLPAPPSASASSGVAVVALAGATDAAWPLARAVYGSPALRPASVDEAHARALCGEPALPTSPQGIRDLVDSVAAVKGDDAPSRTILAEIAHRLSVRAVVVVRVDGGQPSARVFLPDSGTFDAASYAPDPGPTVAWTATVNSLTRAYGVEPPPPPPPSAPALATHEEPVVAGPPPHRKAFYESGWFWGALGAAAFAGGAIFFATRDNGEQTIHLQMEVPH